MPLGSGRYGEDRRGGKRVVDEGRAGARSFVLFADLHGIPRGKLLNAVAGGATIGACRGVLAKDLFGRPVLFDRYARPSGGADVRTGVEGASTFVRADTGRGRPGDGPLGVDRVSIVPLVDEGGGAHPLDARARLGAFLDANGPARTFAVGAELELYLRPLGARAAPVDGQAYATGGLAAREAYLSAVTDALDAFGVDWLAVAQENDEDQYEIALAPTDPLSQADRIVLARLICRALAPRHGLGCTFAPIVSTERSPSHLHVHLSSSAIEVGPVDRPGPLVVGVLERLDELLMVLCPSALSRRAAEIASFASTRTDLGEDDRFRAVRLLGEAGARRAEVRIATAEANPYLAVLGLVGAAATAARGAGAGTPPVARPLGYDLGRSIERFGASRWVTELFGAPLVAHLTELKRAEYDGFDGRDVDTEVRLLRRIL